MSHWLPQITPSIIPLELLFDHSRNGLEFDVGVDSSVQLMTTITITVSITWITSDETNEKFCLLQLKWLCNAMYIVSFHYIRAYSMFGVRTTIFWPSSFTWRQPFTSASDPKYSAVQTWQSACASAYKSVVIICCVTDCFLDVRGFHFGSYVFGSRICMIRPASAFL